MDSKHLAHLAEFQKVLAHYHIAAAAEKILAETKLALFVGPTSSGRNTIIAELLKTGKYHSVISDTTRPPREKDGQSIEQNGREYWFRSEEDILHDLQAGKFVEAALIHNQQVSGISIREIEKAHRSGQIALKDIEPNGAETIYQLKPDATIMFVVPPGFKVWMSRLGGRGRMADAEKRRRLESAVREFEVALNRDYYIFIVNDQLEHALEQSYAHTLQGKHDPQQQARGRQIIEQLLIDTKQFLVSYP